MQFVYLPTGDYVSGYIRDLRSVGISVHDYDLWTEETRPIAERTLEHIRQSMEKPRDFDPFGQTRFAHLWLQYDCPFKVLVLGVNFILPF